MSGTGWRRAASWLIAANFALVVFSLLGTATLRFHFPTPAMDFARLAGIVAQANILIGTSAAFLVMAAGQGGRRALKLLALSALVGGGSEWLCIATGFPYGSYSYTPLLGVAVGGLPVTIPLAWFMVTSTSIHLARQFVSKSLGATVLAGVLVTLWDLVLDPAMTTGFAAWQWHDTGPYYGIPFTNFAGWFTVSVLIAGLFTVLSGVWRPDRSPHSLWLYVVQGGLPAGLALLHGRAPAAIIWALGTGLLCVGLYLRRPGTGGESA